MTEFDRLLINAANALGRAQHARRMANASRYMPSRDKAVRA
ncbi:hypothetical protein [Sphingobium sp. MK2]